MPHRLFALVLAGMMFGPPVAAQTTLSTALVVNEMAITSYEIDQRVLLLRAFGAPGDLRALAIEQLTDDRLRLQAAAQIGLEMDDDDMAAALQEFSQARNLTVDQVRTALAQRGIALASLQDFLRAGMLWREIVQNRFRARATPSESDLDAALGLSRVRQTGEVRLQEIAMPMTEETEAETMALARRLSRELNRGGDFTAAVRRHSRGPSRAQDGRLDWLPEQDLPPAIAGQILALMPGEVTAPVTAPGGVLIFKMLDRRSGGAAGAPAEISDNTLVYSQLVVELPSSASADAVRAAQAQLNAVAAEATLCTDLDRRASEFGLGSGRSTPAPATELPPEIARILAGLGVGGTTVERTGAGVVLFMLCSRGTEISSQDREALRQRLFNQRMVALAQGYLQELRSDAVIEER